MAKKTKFGGNLKTADIDDRLAVLSKQVDRLKTLYEQYFMGILKIPPAQLHREVERGIRELTQLKIRNTAQRYRFTTVSQKYGSYNTYWRRIMREIESGRYVRDVRRASLRAAAKGQEIPAELLSKVPKRVKDRILRERDAIAKRVERAKQAAREEYPDEDTQPDLPAGFGDLAEQREPAPTAPAMIRNQKPHAIQLDDSDALLADLDMDSMFAAITDESTPKPAPRPAPKPAARPAPRRVQRRPAGTRGGAATTTTTPPPPPPPPPPPGMSEKQTRDLFRRYVQARKLVGERTDDLSYDKLMNKLNSQAPKIMKQHKAVGVEFNVVIKEDRVVLKAKPKRK